MGGADVTGQRGSRRLPGTLEEKEGAVGEKMRERRERDPSILDPMLGNLGVKGKKLGAVKCL